MTHSSKYFDGQYSNEQILLKQHEHVWAFLLSHSYSFVSVLFLALIGMWIVQFISDSWMSAIFIFFIVLVPYIIYTIHHYYSTVFYITSRRIIFFTTKGLFGNHRREIRLENITSIRAMRPGLFAKICKFGDLFFSQGGEEFRVSGLHLHDEIRSYIGRIVEYIKSHGYPEQFSIFRSRKERRKEKNTDHGDEMEI